MSKVELIGITKPSAITDCNTANELVAWCARVSNPSNQNNTQTAGKLVKYLINNKHFSPLEMVHVVMNISTTRDIARQILRHRSFAFQEFSQRYADPTTDLSFELREARLQDTKNRQNSVDLNMENSEHRELVRIWNEKQHAVIRAARDAYTWAVQNGIAKEQARAVLPEGNTVSRLYMNGTLRSWIHFIELRSANGTQKEHQVVALACAKAIAAIFPMADRLVSNG